MVNKILLVIKSAPYGNERAAEGLRMATAMIAMDLLPQLLFISDGVYCLLKNQTPEAARLTSFAERLKTLADLIGLHVVSESLKERSLQGSDIDETLNVETISTTEAAVLVAETNAVITF